MFINSSQPTPETTQETLQNIFNSVFKLNSSYFYMEAFKQNLHKKNKKNQSASQTALLFKIICGSHIIKIQTINTFKFK